MQEAEAEGSLSIRVQDQPGQDGKISMNRSWGWGKRMKGGKESGKRNTEGVGKGCGVITKYYK